MHELCEYTKGEGFSEGFDAHLNIEQMNKTSVELFQMYDDHRKGGLIISTEKEFRGYYALLKLDKHPGYKVSICTGISTVNVSLKFFSDNKQFLLG